MRSRSLRTVLARHHGLLVGDYSYGSLLDPAMCDPLTTIGRYVSIGPAVRRFGAAHPLDALSMHPLWYNPRLGLADEHEDVERSPCEIADESWIGAGAVILPGCRRVGTGAVVGAGSVVTRDVPDFAVVVGNPARVVRYRFDGDLQRRLLEMQPWALEPAASVRLRSSIEREYRTDRLRDE